MTGVCAGVSVRGGVGRVSGWLGTPGVPELCQGVLLPGYPCTLPAAEECVPGAGGVPGRAQHSPGHQPILLLGQVHTGADKVKAV